MVLIVWEYHLVLIEEFIVFMNLNTFRGKKKENRQFAFTALHDYIVEEGLLKNNQEEK